MLIPVRILVLIIHELGHACTGLLFYKGSIDVFIGSFGDHTKGGHFKVGRLKIHFIYNPFSWVGGLCVAEPQVVSFTGNFLFILGGPLGSLVAGLLCLAPLLTGYPNEIEKLYLIVAFLYAFGDFVRNLIPSSKAIKLYNGGFTYNDGQLLKQTLFKKHRQDRLVRIAELHDNKDYKNALALYETMDEPVTLPIVLRIVAHMYLHEKKLQAALTTYGLLQKLSVFTADDHCNYALVYSYLDKHNEAIEYYSKALNLDKKHLYALNNRGYSYNLVGEYEKALPDFNKSIEINPGFAYAYNNRGLSKIKLGFVEEGLADIERSIELDVTNSYAYRNKGIYFFDKGNYEEAYALFLKAKELDASMHQIDKYLEEALKLKRQSR